MVMDIDKDIEFLYFVNPVYKLIFEEFKKAIAENIKIDDFYFLTNDDEKLRTATIDILHTQHELSVNWEKQMIFVVKEDEDIKKTIVKSLNTLKQKKIDILLMDLQEKLKEELSDEESNDCLVKIKQLKEISSISAKLLMLPF